MLVHRSKIAADEVDCLLERLRAQTSAALYLAHRLDRAPLRAATATGQVRREIAGELGAQFMDRDVDKTYLAVCRGWPDEAGVIDYALSDVRERSPRKPALTRWRVLATAELAIAIGKYFHISATRSSRRGRKRAATGRFAATFITSHIISSATPVMAAAITIACGACTLACIACCCMRWRLQFAHPVTGEPLRLQASLDDDWRRSLLRCAAGRRADGASAQRSTARIRVSGGFTHAIV